MKSLHDELRRKEAKRLAEGKIGSTILTEKEGIVVNESMNEDLRKIIEEEGKEKNEHNFFQRVFWHRYYRLRTRDWKRGHVRA